MFVKRTLNIFVSSLLMGCLLSVQHISPTVGGFVKRSFAVGVASGLAASFLDVLLDDESMFICSMPFSLYALMSRSYQEALKHHESYKVYKALYENKVILQNQFLTQRALLDVLKHEDDLVSSCRSLALKIHECKRDIDVAKAAWLHDYALSMSLGFTTYVLSLYIGYCLGEVALSSLLERFDQNTQEDCKKNNQKATAQVVVA